MHFLNCWEKHESILMEGALGERLKREFHLTFDKDVAMAGLIYSEQGRLALASLWNEYGKIASSYHLPFLATTPTRRTNRERIERSPFTPSIIQSNVDFLREVQRHQPAEMYVGGLVGCRGDAYTGEGALDLEASRDFHQWEAGLFAESKVDFIYAALMPTIEEAAGMALAIEKYAIPYIISFTISSNGCLIDKTAISDAIRYIDEITVHPPVCYMTNCVHPRIVYQALTQPFNCNETVRTRFAGIQANTSPLPYDQLDNSKELKTSDPAELAEEMVRLREIIPVKIFGGCCGTDGRHMLEIAKRISR